MCFRLFIYSAISYLIIRVCTNYDPALSTIHNVHAFFCDVFIPSYCFVWDCKYVELIGNKSASMPLGTEIRKHIARNQLSRSLVFRGHCGVTADACQIRGQVSALSLAGAAQADCLDKTVVTISQVPIQRAH